MVKEIIRLRIQNEVDIVLAQKRAKELCVYTGMNLASQTKFSTAVSEICRNVQEHVGDGYVHFNIVREDVLQFLEAQVTDFGRGIHNIEYLLSKTVTSGEIKGSGIPNAKRLVHFFSINSVPDKGTKVILRNPIPGKVFITTSVIKQWNEYFLHNVNISPYEELKMQNMELIELTDALNLKNKEADSQLFEIKRLNKELDQFAYIASHDLKAPLKNIEGLLNMLEDDIIEENLEQAKSDCIMIKDQILTMDKLITDILSYSKIGRQNIERTPVDVNTLVVNVLKSLHIPQKFSCIVQELPHLFTEEVFLFQIFSNLIINAIKHHNKENGIITIGSTVTENELFFFVQDDGPGISEMNIKKIFDLFESVDSNYGNTGIGLSIVKNIINIKKTRVWVDSDGQNGSVFNFTWPLEEVLDIYIEPQD